MIVGRAVVIRARARRHGLRSTVALLRLQRKQAAQRIPRALGAIGLQRLTQHEQQYDSHGLTAGADTQAHQYAAIVINRSIVMCRAKIRARRPLMNTGAPAISTAAPANKTGQWAGRPATGRSASGQQQQDRRAHISRQPSTAPRRRCALLADKENEEIRSGRDAPVTEPVRPPQAHPRPAGNPIPAGAFPWRTSKPISPLNLHGLGGETHVRRLSRPGNWRMLFSMVSAQLPQSMPAILQLTRNGGVPALNVCAHGLAIMRYPQAPAPYDNAHIGHDAPSGQVEGQGPGLTFKQLEGLVC